MAKCRRSCLLTPRGLLHPPMPRHAQTQCPATLSNLFEVPLPRTQSNIFMADVVNDLPVHLRAALTDLLVSPIRENLRRAQVGRGNNTITPPIMACDDSGGDLPQRPKMQKGNANRVWGRRFTSLSSRERGSFEFLAGNRGSLLGFRREFVFPARTLWRSRFHTGSGPCKAALTQTSTPEARIVKIRAMNHEFRADVRTTLAPDFGRPLDQPPIQNAWSRPPARTQPHRLQATTGKIRRL